MAIDTENRFLLPPGTTSVWYGRTGDINEAVPSLDRWLTASEKLRFGRYRFEVDRRSFAAGRILLKNALSYYGPNTPPTDWRIVPDEMGALALDPAQNPQRIHINLSRRRQWIACVLSHQRCGVDIEDISRKIDIEGVARAVLTESELDEMAALTALERRRFFFEHWCLKEAYLKALGVGFHMEPTRIRVRPGPLMETVAPVPAGTADRATRFRFALFTPGPTHLLAVTHEAADEEPVERDSAPPKVRFDVRDCHELPFLR